MVLHLALLALLLGGLSAVVYAHVKKLRLESHELRAFARELAPSVTSFARFKTGHRVSLPEGTLAFCPDVSTGSSLRAGVVDTWRVELAAPALADRGAFFLRARQARAAERDVEQQPMTAVVVESDDAAVHEALAVGGSWRAPVEWLLSRHPVRGFALEEGGVLAVVVERRLAAVRELAGVVKDVRAVVAAWSTAAADGPARGAGGLGPASGEPVPVPVAPGANVT